MATLNLQFIPCSSGHFQYKQIHLIKQNIFSSIFRKSVEVFRLCSTQGVSAFDIPTFFAAAMRVVIRCARKLCKLMNSRPTATRVVSPMK